MLYYQGLCLNKTYFYHPMLQTQIVSMTRLKKLKEFRAHGNLIGCCQTKRCICCRSNFTFRSLCFNLQSGSKDFGELVKFGQKVETFTVHASIVTRAMHVFLSLAFSHAPSPQTMLKESSDR